MDLLIQGLRKIVNDKKQNDIINEINNNNNHFQTIYLRLKGDEQSYLNNPTLKTIPRFHKLIDDYSDENSIQFKFDLEKRTMFLQRISSGLLETDQLETIKSSISQLSSQSVANEKMLNYQEYKVVGSKCKGYLSPRLFGMLQDGGMVSAVKLFTYVMRKSWQKKTRLSLSIYDNSGRGYLKESEMEDLISDLVEDCSHLKALDDSFRPFYICTVVSKFFFFLDPLGSGKVRMKDMLASHFLDDLLILRNHQMSPESQEKNWFSVVSALRVYGQYLELDKDGNGMLSQSELQRLGSATLTHVFVSRIFQEYQTYNGQVDYKSYLDLLLAIENKGEPQALRYFFRLLDINRRGYLDAFCLNYFFRGIQDEMRKRNLEPLRFEDIEDELLDMVSPLVAGRITMKDLEGSKYAECFVSILIDLNEFLNYESREWNN